MCANCLRIRALNTSLSSLQSSLQDSLYDYLLNIYSLFLFIYFLFFSDEGSTLETLDFTIRILSDVYQTFHISICISTLPTQDTTFNS